MEKLKKTECPFCGGYSLLFVNEEVSKSIYIKCCDCVARGPSSEYYFDQRYSDPGFAWSDWNMRGGHT